MGQNKEHKIILTYTKIMRENISLVLLITLAAGIGTGLFTSMPGLFIRKFDLALVVIMIGVMGFTITFKNLTSSTRGVIELFLGLVLNFLFAPFLCWILALLLLGKYPEFATGLILIGAVPSAGMALMWTGLLEADTSLAALINALTLIIAPFAIPFLMLFFAGKFVNINVPGMLKNLIYTILLPVLGSVGIREAVQKKIDVKRYLPLMPAISATAATLLLFMAINTAIPFIKRNLKLIVPLLTSTVFIFPVLFLVSFLICSRFLSKEKNIALTYTCGMKNLAIALGIAAVNFKEEVMLPVAASFAFQMLTAVFFYELFSRRLKSDDKT
ncbi:hypothetical protein H5U35_04730 [Candidatus Aerophobetes bacterium]|nr:hypothetical protein [Candidatus Aerophobetes bacterium]